MLHEILTDRRKSLGMSIDQLVEKSGVPKGTVSKVLTGVSPNPALETIKAIAYALGLTLNDLDEARPAELSAEAVAIAKAYDMMSDYGKSIIDFIVAQEEKQRKESFGKPKIMCGGVEYKKVPVVLGKEDSKTFMEYTSAQEQKELAEETKTKEKKT
jgi:transcriptional regulator with XRE-family HTH domain